MAQDSSSSLSYFLLVEKTNKDDLAPLRKWGNLKVSFDKDQIWVTNFDHHQIESIEVKSVPYKTIFYRKESKLFLLNSLLPDRNEPNFLWTPIERAFPLEIKNANHNYFGIEEKVTVKLVRDELEREAEILLTNISTLENYLNTAPAIRLKNLTWVVIGTSEVLIFGKPLLPISGTVFWKNQEAIIPVGYNFELSILSETINKKLNSNKTTWVIWFKDATYFALEKSQLMPLTLSSFRKTKQKLSI
ncbi:MAG: hypothetical protein AB8F94_28130 [Saprospiraceae bacterium]